jgi:methionyl-tRNA formyltransferase
MSSQHRIVYFGTSTFAARILEILIERGQAPLLVVTQPDQPQGRGLVMQPTPVKLLAEKHSIDVVTPETLKAHDIPPELSNSEWDLGIVAAYGMFIPDSLLALPRRGMLNVHPSLLPALRGPSPIVSAILRDEKESIGTTIILLDSEMDHGPIVAQARVTLDEWPIGAKTLEALLAEQSGELLADAIEPWLTGDIEAEPQDHTAATFTKKISKEDGRLDLSGSAYENYLKICALEGWPGTHFFVQKNGKNIRVKIAGAIYEGGRLAITRVIPEGKKEMTYSEFTRGYQ